jgi:hypothetical protein
MKKMAKKKLTLNKETIVTLESGDLVKIAGGLTEPSVCSACTAYSCLDTI